MSALEFNKLLHQIKDLPDRYLVRLVRAAADELLKRSKKVLRDLTTKPEKP